MKPFSGSYLERVAISHSPTGQETIMTRGLGGQSPANITHHLKGIDFPASREDLERQAKENGAGEDVLDIIRQLPDQQYDSIADVTKGVGDVEQS